MYLIISRYNNEGFLSSSLNEFYVRYFLKLLPRSKINLFFTTLEMNRTF